jgi:hypothetical protein
MDGFVKSNNSKNDYVGYGGLKKQLNNNDPYVNRAKSVMSSKRKSVASVIS